MFFEKPILQQWVSRQKSQEKPLCKQRIQRELLLSALIVEMLSVIVGGLVVIAGVLAKLFRAG
jgi:hypothetical protein